MTTDPAAATIRAYLADLTAGFRGEDAVECGVTEEHALETVLEWLSPECTMELCAEAMELYIWDRSGSDN